MFHGGRGWAGLDGGRQWWMARPHRRGDRSGEGLPRPEPVSLLPGGGRRIGVGGRGPRHRSDRARRSCTTALPVQQREHRRHGVRRRDSSGPAPTPRAAPAIDARTGQLRSIHLGNLLIAAAASHGIVAVSCNAAADSPDSRSRSRVLRVGFSLTGSTTPIPPSHSRPKARVLAAATAGRDLRRAVYPPGLPRAAARLYQSGQRAGTRITRRAHLDHPDPHRRAVLSTLGPGCDRRRCPCHPGPRPVTRLGSDCAGGTHPGRSSRPRLISRSQELPVFRGSRVRQRRSRDHDPPAHARPSVTSGPAVLLRPARRHADPAGRLSGSPANSRTVLPGRARRRRPRRRQTQSWLQRY